MRIYSLYTNRHIKMTSKSFKNNFFALLKLAIPLAFTGVVQAAVFFFETLFLAHLGKEVLAAGALVSWLFATFAVIFFGALSSINILVSHKYGANDHDGISLVVRDGLLMALCFSIPIFFLSWNMAPIFLFFGQSASVVTLAQAYLHALAWGVIPNFIMIALLDFVIGLGHARTVMLFSMLAVSLTISFSYVLIFGKFGFPAYGIAGAGWGVALGNIISTCVLIIFVITQKTYRQYLHGIFTFKKPVFLWELMHVGIPIGLMYCVEVGFFFALSLLMGTFGTVFLAANQIVMQYLGLLMSMIFSIAQAITVRMGHLLGAREYKSAEQAAFIGMSISGIFMLLIGFVFWIFPEYLIGIDFNVRENKNQDLVHYTTQFFMISPIFQILEAVRISLFGVLRALKDTRFTLLTSIISFWCLSLPIGYGLATHFHLAGLGFWWGMIIGVAVSIWLLMWRFRFKIKLDNQYNHAHHHHTA